MSLFSACLFNYLYVCSYTHQWVEYILQSDRTGNMQFNSGLHCMDWTSALNIKLAYTSQPILLNHRTKSFWSEWIVVKIYSSFPGFTNLLFVQTLSWVAVCDKCFLTWHVEKEREAYISASVFLFRINSCYEMTRTGRYKRRLCEGSMFLCVFINRPDTRYAFRLSCAEVMMLFPTP